MFLKLSMKVIILFFSVLFINACSQEKVEYFVFKKTVESDLIDKCGEDNEGCIQAVKSQIDSCMIKSNWREILGKEDDADLIIKFVKKFYPCFKDENGESLFDA